MEMSATPLRVGIIGAGHMGSVHARHWARVPGVTIVGVADAFTAKADALVAQYAGATAFATVEALLAASVDAVSVCVPTDRHVEVAKETLATGVHTICEKPLALTVADCDAIITARDAAPGGTLLTVGHVARFFPEYAQAKRLIDSGAIGAPAAARTRRGGDFPQSDTDWFADPSRSGGVITDLMVHDLDFLQWCFGPVTRVYARSLTERLAGKDLNHLDYALLTLRHQSGVISHAEGTWADPGGFVTTFDLAGDGGLLTHDSRRAAPLYRAHRRPDGTTPTPPTPLNPLAPSDDPYYRQLLAFAASIRDGAPLAVTAEDARRAVAVALAAQESARTGRAVEIGDR